MEFLLFGGPSGSGKSALIRRLAAELVNNRGYTVIGGTFPPPVADWDIFCVLQGTRGQILIQSGMDNIRNIEQLRERIGNYPATDVVICAVRDPGDEWRRRRFWEEIFPGQAMNLLPANVREIPLGRPRRGNNRNISMNWYLDSVEPIAWRIASEPPFNL